MLVKETKTTFRIEGSNKPQVIIILVLAGLNAALLLLLHFLQR